MLQPVVFGLNYQTADFELRNRLAFASEEVPSVLKRLVNSGIVKEVVLLSTCNRTELYFVAKDVDFVINSLCDMHKVCPHNIRNHSYVYSGEECAHHLFRVISGLDSMVLGETEIVAQIKSAMDCAKYNQTLGSCLAGLFQMSLSTEKDVRSHTEINNVAISMGHAVVNYVEQYIAQLPNRKVLFVGAGQMMQQIAPHFHYLQLDKLMIVNRTVEKASLIATKINAEVGSLEQISNIINEYAIIVICCASNQPLITETMLQLETNNQLQKLIIDLSMPLVISNSLFSHNSLKILTVDDIAKLVDIGIDRRKAAAIEAESIIANKLSDYHAWMRKRSFTPLIRKFKQHSELIREESLLQAEKQLANGVNANEVLQQLSTQLTNRLLHSPLVNINTADENLQDELIELFSYLYDLKL